jgi:hypothetical protein
VSKKVKLVQYLFDVVSFCGIVTLAVYISNSKFFSLAGDRTRDLLIFVFSTEPQQLTTESFTYLIAAIGTALAMLPSYLHSF